MQMPFAFSVSSGSPALYESEFFGWILFAISAAIVAIFLFCSWSLFHNLKASLPIIGLLALHPRLWLDAYHGDGGTTLRSSSILFLAVIATYAVGCSIFLCKNRRRPSNQVIDHKT
jgi:hypothetical protein